MAIEKRKQRATYRVCATAARSALPPASAVSTRCCGVLRMSLTQTAGPDLPEPGRVADTANIGILHTEPGTECVATSGKVQGCMSSRPAATLPSRSKNAGGPALLHSSASAPSSWATRRSRVFCTPPVRSVTVHYPAWCSRPPERLHTASWVPPTARTLPPRPLNSSLLQHEAPGRGAM